MTSNYDIETLRQRVRETEARLDASKNDALREGLGTLFKGIGWAIGFIAFGLMWAFSNGINPFAGC